MGLSPILYCSPRILSTCPVHTNNGCGKREAQINWSMVVCKEAAPVTGTTFEDYWLCAGGLSAVNAIGVHLRDPINSGLSGWRMAV